MTDQNTEMANKDNKYEESCNDIEASHRRGKIIGGMLVVAVGSLFLARELGVEIPTWVFTWKMLLIGMGVVVAIKHKFRNPTWLMLIAIGGAFLINDLYPEMQIKPILWPSLIILLGLFIIFKPRRKYSDKMNRHWNNWNHRRHRYKFEKHMDFSNYEEPTKEDFIDSTAFMAGVKKNVLSKTFQGGDITNVFGGTELNLVQADFEGKAVLELTQVFGGTKLIIPSNWQVRSTLVTVFGSVEDKRAVQPNVSTEPLKVLELTGTTFFGGIEIRSY
jgi:predicted membrane protein